MRILLLFNDGIGDVRSFSRRLHLEFLLRLGEFYDLKLYGPGVYELNEEDFITIRYNDKISAGTLVNEIKPDILICFSHVLTNKWLPSDFKKITHVPKVLVEGDYHDVRNRRWYTDNKFDLVIHRGTDFHEDAPSVWMPLAADDIFCTNIDDVDHSNRKIGVLYLGTYLTYPYKDVRRNAIRKLDNAGLLKGRLSDEELDSLFYELESCGHVYKGNWKKFREDFRYIVGYNEYPSKLKEYRCSLSCAGGTLKHTVGKVYEIMASGTVLLSQEFLYHKRLFGKDSCVFYKDDCSDIVEKADMILEDIDYSEYIAKNAVSVINKHHLASHRILEMCNILDALCRGKEIPRKWGI